MRPTRAVLPLLLSAAVACTTDSIDNGGPPGGSPDAGVVERNCAVPESFGTVGALAGNAELVAQQDGSGMLYRFNADLDDATVKDALSLQLWDDRAPFTGQVTTGSFTLGSADANFNTCGTCVTIVADIVPMQGPTEFYIAQSGTLQIDSVDGTLSGSVSDLTLVKFDLATGTPISDGCDTTIASASFSASL
jgi:hypothetical protein